jgi:Fur family ferric uptake transcriptional regulator
MNVSRTLSSANLKKTKARTAVLECISHAKTPVSIQDLETAPLVRKLTVDQATLYRIIHILLDNHIIREVNFHEGKTRYELATLPHHHHIVCTQCGNVQDVSDCLDKKAANSIEKESGYSVVAHALEFFGLCPSCRIS